MSTPQDPLAVLVVATVVVVACGAARPPGGRLDADPARAAAATRSVTSADARTPAALTAAR